MNAVTPAVLLATALYSFVNFVKYLRAGDWNGVLTLLAAAVAGVGAIALGAHSDATAHLQLVDGGKVLGLTDGGTQVLLGIEFGLAAGTVADFRKAFDRTTTSAKPQLLSGKIEQRDAA
jgi:hypothetical protein